MGRNQTKARGIGATAVAILALLSTLSLVLSGQDPVQEPLRAAAAHGNTERFQVRSDLVLVPVTVITGNGRAVPGLTKEHFSVFDDSVQQVITHFTSENAPATIGLVFDASGSMHKRLAKAQEAVYAVLENANPDDEFFFIRFSDRPELEVPLTSQVDEVRRAVQDLRVDGSTALLDAVHMAWREMGKARYTRKAIILISDGEDNNSSLSTPEFRQLAAENDTTIYTIFIGEFSDNLSSYANKQFGMGLLNDIAHRTGGHMFTVSRLKELPKIAAKIGSWIRSQYVLGYVPADESRNGGYHHISVKISKPTGFPRLHPAWRLSYYVPEG